MVGSGAFQGEGRSTWPTSRRRSTTPSSRSRAVTSRRPRRPRTSGASVDCAVVEAAYRTLSLLLRVEAGCRSQSSTATTPRRSRRESERMTAERREGDSGRTCGSERDHLPAYRRRADDADRLSSSFDPRCPGPGVWRLTPPFAAPQTPWLGTVRPFLAEETESVPAGALRLRSRASGGSTPSTRSRHTVRARTRHARRTRRRPRGSDSANVDPAVQLGRAEISRRLTRSGCCETARLLAMVNTVECRRAHVDAQCQVQVPVLAAGDCDRSERR